MTQKHVVRIATLLAGFLPALAFAHPGHGEASSFAAGALHLLSGADHVAGFLIVGILAARLGGRYLWPAAAAFLGLLVAASTTSSEGWQYASGFMLAGAGLIAAGVVSATVAIRLSGSAFTAAGRRSPT
jgi:hydrogenase/urease accessory protein HupE